MSKPSHRRRNTAQLIARIAVCKHCLQYISDCECCKACGGADVHEHGCQEATTKRESFIMKTGPDTVRGLGPGSPVPALVVLVDEDASGSDSTCKVVQLRPTMRSPQ